MGAAIIPLVGIAAVVVWTGQGLWPTGFPRAPLPASKGTLEVRLKDHREAIVDFLKLEVRLDSVRIHPKGAPRKLGWLTLQPVRGRIDLTKYIGGNSASILKGKVGTGPYEAIDLKLKGIEGMLKKTGKGVRVKNQLGPIRLPFSIHEKKATLIVIDLTVIDISDHPPRGYELHIKGYELYTDGRLIKKIPPE